MSTCVQEAERNAGDLYVIDPDDEPEEPVDEPALRDMPARGEFADRWLRTDPLTELLDQLRLIGRPREAEVIEQVLGLDDDEEAMRAYVSQQWADAWDSPEDAIYDQW